MKTNPYKCWYRLTDGQDYNEASAKLMTREEADKANQEADRYTAGNWFWAIIPGKGSPETPKGGAQ